MPIARRKPSDASPVLSQTNSRCPNCWESEGGCNDLRACDLALARTEREYANVVANLSSHLGSPVQQRFECPNGGPSEVEGDCPDPKESVDGTARTESRFPPEINCAWDDPSSTSRTRLLLVGLQALDLLRIGLVVCDVSGQLLATNRTAGEILRTRDGLELNSDGTLCAPQGCSQPLEEVVRRAAEAAFFGEPGSHDAALSVRRASGKRPLTLLVRSVRKISTADHSGRPAALVLILDSALSVKTTHAELRQIYGLTSTETHLANLLMEGRTLKDCCSKLGISQATARTHLKHLFKKTRVRCQSELVSLILRSVGLARLGSALTEA